MDEDKSHRCIGKFPFTQEYWIVEAKISKSYLKSNPIYTLRTYDDDDAGQPHDRNIEMPIVFLRDCLNECKGFSKELKDLTMACFNTFWR